MTGIRLVVACVAVGVAAVGVGPAGAARPGLTSRVSVSSSGAQANGPSGIDSGAGAHRAAISGGGRFVAFGSSATNLVPGDTNKLADVFVHDALRRTTVRVSVSSSGAQGIESLPVTVPGTVPYCSMLYPARPGAAQFTDPVGSPSLSADGQSVAFTSCFTNLVPDDTNAASDVFVHDLRSGTTTRVSLTSAGQQSVYSSWGGSLSDNGRMIVFSSQGVLDPASSSCTQSPEVLSLLPTLCGDGTQVYAHDMMTGRTFLVSATPGHLAGNGPAEQASISPDGRYSLFVSRATDLVAGQSTSDPNPPWEVYLRDLVKGSTRMLSVGIDGAPSDKDCFDAADSPGNSQHAISTDDRYVMFGCNGTNLVPNFGPATHSTGNGEDIYVRDLRTGRLERASVDSSGGTLNQDVEPSMSRDGRFVTFYAGNPPTVCPCAWNGQQLLHDNVTGATEFVSIASGDAFGKPATPSSLGGDVSADGRHVAFLSQGADLVAGDTNGVPDVFVRDRGAALGVGGLAGSRKLTVRGAASFPSTGLVSAVGTAPAVVGGRAIPGTELAAAALAYRPASADLFVRLSLTRMPTFAAASPAVVYGLALTVNGSRYEVRAAKTGVDASYGLFALHAGLWTQVATLTGGYGTTGEDVVVALPLRDIGAARGGSISEVKAFTGVGSYLGGAAEVLDTVQLAP